MFRQAARKVTRSTPSAGRSRGLSKLAAAKQQWGSRLVIDQEIEHALETGTKEVIALETAIVTHGMPYPHNLNTALSLESIIKSESNNAVLPATIALLSGRIHIGLTRAELSSMSEPSDSSSTKPQSIKVSRRDLTQALARGLNGGTTVAGTMILADQVGIELFVTGGIGGVHRGATQSMDISADLQELSKTPMGVVCAGAKSILDLGLTLEVLETLGVNVTTIGESNDFPAFYTRASGFKSPYFVRTPEEAASLLYTSLHQLPPSLRASQLFATPIPSTFEPQGAQIQAAVEQAVRESVEQGIDKRGKEVTPWLLKRVGELTQGKALESNIALIENNAKVGTKIALELLRLKQEGKGRVGTNKTHPVPAFTVPQSHSSTPPATLATSSDPLPQPKVVIFGSAAIDITAKASPSSSSILHTTALGQISYTAGGVGRNIAECSTKLLPPGSVVMVSAIGSSSLTGEAGTSEADAFGAMLINEMSGVGMRTDGLVLREGMGTGVCNLILGNEGGLVAGVADMDVVETVTENEVVDALGRYRPEMVVFDANLESKVVSTILRECQRLKISTMFDPTSMPKLDRIMSSFKENPPNPAPAPRLLTHISPNNFEVKELYACIEKLGLTETDSWFSFINSLRLGANWRNGIERLAGGNRGELEWLVHQGVAQMMVSLLPWVDNVWLKVGEQGLIHLGIVDASVSSKLPEGARMIEHELPEGEFSGKGMDRPVLRLSHYPPPQKLENMVSSTGAGDSLVGGLVAGLISRAPGHQIAQIGLRAARASLMSARAVGDVKRLE